MKPIFLVDPNDYDTDNLINQINKSDIPFANLWLGCSVTHGREFKETIKKINKDFTLFPGRIDQILENANESKSIIIPHPFPITDISKGLENKASDLLNKNKIIKDKVNHMLYLLLSLNCSAAKVLNIENVPTKEEIFTFLQNNPNITDVYIEGGSRNKEVNFDIILHLLEDIKNVFSSKRIIYGGGISDLSQAKEIGKFADNVVFSNMIHKNPDQIHNILHSMK